MELPDVVRKALCEGLGGDVGAVHVQVRKLKGEIRAEIAGRGVEVSLGQCVVELGEGWVVDVDVRGLIPGVCFRRG